MITETNEDFFLEKVEVGMFRLPGIKFEKGQFLLSYTRKCLSGQKKIDAEHR